MAGVYKNLENALIYAVKQMREDIANLEDPPSYLNFNIEVDGRVLDGDLEIKFSFDGGSYKSVTRGGNLANVVDEYLRRYGWNSKNDALCLPRVDNNDEPREDE
jgi:hypothetical protein